MAVSACLRCVFLAIMNAPRFPKRRAQRAERLSALQHPAKFASSAGRFRWIGSMQRFVIAALRHGARCAVSKRDGWGGAGLGDGGHDGPAFLRGDFHAKNAARRAHLPTRGSHAALQSAQPEGHASRTNATLWGSFLT